MRIIRRWMAGMALLASPTLLANYYTLRVFTRDAQHLSVSLKDNMQTSFSDGTLTLTSALGDITFDIADVTHWCYLTKQYVDAGWLSVDSPSLPAALSIADGVISLHGVAPSATVHLFDASGLQLRLLTGSSDYSISCSDLPAGAYILSFGNNSYKFAISR